MGKKGENGVCFVIVSLGRVVPAGCSCFRPFGVFTGGFALFGGLRVFHWGGSLFVCPGGLPLFGGLRVPHGVMSASCD